MADERVTLESLVRTGDLKELAAVIGRLQDFLPEYGRTRTDEQFHGQCQSAAELEDRWHRAVARAREEAGRIVASVRANWSVAEIERACGYPAGPKTNTARGDIVEFNGRRYVAVVYRHGGWFYLPVTKSGDRPDHRACPQRLLDPVKVGVCDPKYLKPRHRKGAGS